MIIQNKGCIVGGKYESDSTNLVYLWGFDPELLR